MASTDITHSWSSVGFSYVLGNDDVLLWQVKFLSILFKFRADILCLELNNTLKIRFVFTASCQNQLHSFLTRPMKCFSCIFICTLSVTVKPRSHHRELSQWMCQSGRCPQLFYLWVSGKWRISYLGYVISTTRNIWRLYAENKTNNICLKHAISYQRSVKVHPILYEVPKL